MRAKMLACSRKFRLERIGKTAGHRLLVTEHLLGEFGIDFTRCLAVFAANIALDLLADRLVAAAEENVDCCLYADHLRKRRYQRRITHIGTHARRFGEYLIETVDCILCLELCHQI